MRQDALTQLRALLYEDPDPEVWRQVVAAVASFADPADRKMATDYVTGHLDGWPDELRVAPRDWWEAWIGKKEVVGWTLVRCLDLSGGQYKAPKARKLLKSPAMADFTALLLRIANNDLRTNAVDDLVNSPLAKNLTALDLSGNRLLIASTRSLVTTSNLGALESLWVEDGGMSGKTASLFSRATNLPSLRRLFLGRNGLGAGGLAPMAEGPLLASSALTNLEVLRVDDQPGLRQIWWESNVRRLTLDG